MDVEQLKNECPWYWTFDGSLRTGPPRNLSHFKLFRLDIAMNLKNRFGMESGGLWGTRKAWWVHGCKPKDEGFVIDNDIFFHHRMVECFDETIYRRVLKFMLDPGSTFEGFDFFGRNKYLEDIVEHYKPVVKLKDPPVYINDVCCFYCNEETYQVLGEGYERGTIVMPAQHLWGSQSDFYQSLFHELMHWYIDKNKFFLMPIDDELICELGSARAMQLLRLPQSENFRHYLYFLELWEKYGSISEENIKKAEEWITCILKT